MCCPIPWYVSQGIPIGMTFPWTSLIIAKSNLAAKFIFSGMLFVALCQQLASAINGSLSELPFF